MFIESSPDELDLLAFLRVPLFVWIKMPVAFYMNIVMIMAFVFNFHTALLPVGFNII